MYQPLLNRFSIIVQLAIALFCLFAMTAAQAHSGHGTHDVDEREVKGGDFTLTSANGPVSLHDFRGKVVVIYFGYTHCTDICPLTLGKLGSVLTQWSRKKLPGYSLSLLPWIRRVTMRNRWPPIANRSTPS